MNVIHLKRQDIDKNKWNSCVYFSGTGNICGYMWYLDAISRDWEGLVEEGYGSIFPIFWKKDWLGRKYLYQPDLVPVGGIYSERLLSATRVQQLLTAIPEQYRKVKLRLSGKARISSNNLSGWTVEKFHKKQLLMNRPFEEIQKGFSQRFSEKLETAQSTELRPASNLKPETIADFYKKHSPHYRKENYFAYQRIMYNALHRGWGISNGVQNKKGELLAVNFMVFSHGKIQSILSVTSKEGQQLGAQELLLRLMLQTHANKPVLLDFNEYEDLGIGATKESYWELKRN